MRIAVIGAGIAGLGAAWSLSRRHDVVLYEAEARLGGHANTASIVDGDRRIPVDTGFIVYNERAYPNLTRLFDALGVTTEPSEMSFSVSVGHGSFEYQARGAGFLAQPSNITRGGYRRMMRDIVRFTGSATGAVREGTLGDFLRAERYSDAFRDDFLLPMIACIWSSSLEAMLDYPFASLVGFLDNHGLLDIYRRPRWRTVHGGSAEYVRRIAAAPVSIRTGTRVTGLRRGPDGVTVWDANGVDVFDDVVVASHADAALSVLGSDATADERHVLGSFRYQDNIAVLHRDPSLMPSRRRVWSSWNYLADPREATGRKVSLTYWMNRLQNLTTERPVFVTLNPARTPAHVEGVYAYRHPQFDGRAVDAQRSMDAIQGARRTWFCGSYHGYGFHEDALRSGLEVAARLGSPAPWWDGEEPQPTPIPATIAA